MTRQVRAHRGKTRNMPADSGHWELNESSSKYDLKYIVLSQRCSFEVFRFDIFFPWDKTNVRGNISLLRIWSRCTRQCKRMLPSCHHWLWDKSMTELSSTASGSEVLVDIHYCTVQRSTARLTESRSVSDRQISVVGASERTPSWLPAQQCIALQESIPLGPEWQPNLKRMSESSPFLDPCRRYWLAGDDFFKFFNHTSGSPIVIIYLFT